MTKRKTMSKAAFVKALKPLKGATLYGGLIRFRTGDRCPIERVANVERGSYNEGGRKLGLRREAVSDVISAADNRLGRLLSLTTDYRCSPLMKAVYRRRLRLRRQMLKALGLKEAA